ncbi:hypothetical protein DSAG12_03860 [Promethearchaeum syntrophicum]|uniref:Uncharacterized protein n=1 Tax=Promethearchaeum syntrophicum TaxID=2594042 RepID=A0A5B9DFY5_9ARCH|nr:hypothetical protein [Candidatus Prometheoarchaeum syntrophicum]QEE18022.1 hypothetical protein DSAG12_03860 [Candidatus Prometheoarchaeum syntrophicum]
MYNFQYFDFVELFAQVQEQFLGLNLLFQILILIGLGLMTYGIFALIYQVIKAAFTLVFEVVKQSFNLAITVIKSLGVIFSSVFDPRPKYEVEA